MAKYLVIRADVSPLRDVRRPGRQPATLAATTGTLSAWGSKNVTLTIYSTPEGAVMTENGKIRGYAPITLVYTVGQFRTGHTTPPVSVRWPSGAAAAVEAVSLCPEVGKDQAFTFERPTVAAPAPRKWVASWLTARDEMDHKPGIQIPAPGLEIDLRSAFRRELLARRNAIADRAGE